MTFLLNSFAPFPDSNLTLQRSFASPFSTPPTTNKLSSKTLLLAQKHFRSSWNDIAVLTGNPGSYNWTIPNTPSTTCLVKITCYDAASNSGYDVSNNYFTITEAPPETPMFVESITMSKSTQGINVTAYATPKVVEDVTGNPALEGVTIYGHWYGATSDIDQCITGSDGTCTVASNKVKNPSQQFCFQVDSLVKTNYYWDNTKGVTYNCISPTAKLSAGTPSEFSVSSYPNPFNLITSISFSLPTPSEVNLTVYNIL